MSAPHRRRAPQERVAAVLVLLALPVWLALSAVGGHLGWPVRFAVLIDLMCMAALVWALVVLYRAWAARQDDGV